MRQDVDFKKLNERGRKRSLNIEEQLIPQAFQTPCDYRLITYNKRGYIAEGNIS